MLEAPASARGTSATRAPYRSAVVSVEQVSDPGRITQARRVQASTYLQRNYIAAEDVVDGVMSTRVDPWVPNSVYFAAFGSEHDPIGVIRLILWDPDDTLPALRHCQVWPEHAREVQEATPAVAEVSALAVKQGAPQHTAVALYQAIWEYGRRHNHLMWLMLMDHSLRALLHAVLGPITYVIGDEQSYMGGRLVPTALRTCDTHTIIANSAQRRGNPSLGDAFPHNAAWERIPQPGLTPPRSAQTCPPSCCG